jgi:hypothetical protein
VGAGASLAQLTARRKASMSVLHKIGAAWVPRCFLSLPCTPCTHFHRLT